MDTVPTSASAIWYTAPGQVALRQEDLPSPRPGEVRVRMLYSGISRGTERLVSAGRVPQAEWTRMRAPMQRGDFPFPVKYGYCAVGIIEAGPSDLLGRRVFCLHPHQDRFNAPADVLVPLPDGVPPRRATLAANMETALNALWDSGVGPADRIAVVGGGILGLLVGMLAARVPGTEVSLFDTDPGKAPLVQSLGLRFGQQVDCDAVFHASASAEGLATAIAHAGDEATIVELSWYGAEPITVPLGGAFHSRRLCLVASQVGMVARSHRPRWSHRRRLAAALDLLRDDRLNALVTGTIDLVDAPRLLPDVLADGASGLPPVIRYPAAT